MVIEKKCLCHHHHHHLISFHHHLTYLIEDGRSAMPIYKGGPPFKKLHQ